MTIEEMDGDSRVWIYQANREFTESESAEIEELCNEFVRTWDAHGSALYAAYGLYYNRFLVFCVDEKKAGVTGCSIDRSVALVKELEGRYGVDFFDRMLVAYRKDSEIVTEKMHDFWALRKAHVVHDNTIVFNNLVKDRKEFSENWETSFSNSWHATMW